MFTKIFLTRKKGVNILKITLLILVLCLVSQDCSLKLHVWFTEFYMCLHLNDHGLRNFWWFTPKLLISHGWTIIGVICCTARVQS